METHCNFQNSLNTETYGGKKKKNRKNDDKMSPQGCGNIRNLWSPIQRFDL